MHDESASTALARRRLIVEPRPTDFSSHRKTMIGGTDLAPILGISERRTRFAVWASKMGQAREDPSLEDEREAGIYYEPFILRRFGEKYDLEVLPCTVSYRLAAAPFLGANPDAFVRRHGETRVFAGADAKTRSPFQRGMWGAPGSADIPVDEVCQMQWYMEICDLPLWYVPVFFDRVLVLFVVPRDRELGALMIEEATAFWNEFIVTGKEPPFEGPAAAAYLRQKYPRVLEPMREADPTVDMLVARRDLLKRHLAVLERRLDVVEGALKEKCGAAPGILGRGYKVQWNEIKAKTATDWRAVVTDLRSFPVVDDEATAAKVRAALDDAILRHTHTGEPTRALRVNFKGPRSLPPVTLEPVEHELAALPPSSKEEDE